MDDLRNPIGVFFILLGVLLLTQTGARAELSTAPVNLYTGAAAIGFGLAMLGLAYRGRKSGG